MNISIGLGLRPQQEGGTSAPELGALAWSTLWLAPYAGAPWAGETTAGASAGRDMLDAAAIPPTVGAAVDGRAPAVFADSLLEVTGLNWETMTGTGDHAIFVLAKTSARIADQAHPINEDGLFCDASQSAGLFVAASGMRGFIFDGASKITPYVAFSNGTWTLLKFKRDGANIYAGKNGDAWTAGVASGEMSGAGLAGRLGWNYGTNLDGEILMAGCLAYAPTDASIDNDIRAALAALFPSISI